MTQPICFKTPRKVAIEMLKLAEVKPDDLVYDLGAGDGEVIITAAKEFGAKAIGIEIKKELVSIAEKRIMEEGVSHLAKVIHGDFFEINISDATVITLYLLRKTHELLKTKFEMELKNGTRIVSHMIPIPGWEPIAIKTVYVGTNPHVIYLYVMGKSNFDISEVKRAIRKAVANLHTDDVHTEDLAIQF